MRRRMMVGLLAAMTVTPLQAQTPSNAFQDLLNQAWERGLRENPTFASLLGDLRYNDRWPDLSLQFIEKQFQDNRATLVQLAQIDRSQLSVGDQLNYDLFKDGYERGIEEQDYRWYLLPVTQRGGIQTEDDIARQLSFKTLKDYQDWLKRLETFPDYMDQTIALMEEGIKQKIVHPKVIMQRIPAQIDKQIVADPVESPFYYPFKKFPETISVAERTRLINQAKKLITDQVIPSYYKFKAFFTQQYLPACFDQIGVWQIPKGDQYYLFVARKFTTTTLTPKEIHELGLSEVKRIRSAMDTIIQKVGFKGTFAEFLTFLRTDPQFYYSSSAELLDAYRAMSKRIDPNLVKIFKKLPRAPYGITPIPEAIAPDTTTAYYNEPAADGSRAGTYFVNLHKPETRPKYEMMALSLHEGVPGHHLQIALAQELGQIPNFRRYGGYTAFIEGWGLYAESLGEDMDLYDDPYSKFGQLTYEMWRAVRLVVDTGIHYYRWDRQKAIDYFLANAAKSELDVINEIDRYISWPGQALAYKVGELKIKELRARAQQHFGEKFDLRAFHDIVLSSGAVPLNILERIVDQWLQQTK